MALLHLIGDCTPKEYCEVDRHMSPEELISFLMEMENGNIRVDKSICVLENLIDDRLYILFSLSQSGMAQVKILDANTGVEIREPKYLFNEKNHFHTLNIITFVKLFKSELSLEQNLVGKTLDEIVSELASIENLFS